MLVAAVYNDVRAKEQGYDLYVLGCILGFDLSDVDLIMSCQEQTGEMCQNTALFGPPFYTHGVCAMYCLSYDEFGL